MQGNKQSYTANLRLSFTGGAPDYTASGTFYTVAGKIFTEQPMTLSKNGVPVGKFILVQDEGGSGTPQGEPSGDGQYDDTFFKVIEQGDPSTIIVGEGDLELADGQLSGAVTGYNDSKDFASDTV